MAEMSKNLKEGERFLAPSRRPDGSFRNPIRIRHLPVQRCSVEEGDGGFTEGAPGYDPALDGKTRTKTVKRNERKKEQRLQAALVKGINSDVASAGERIEMIGNPNHGLESVTSLATQIDGLSVSANCADNNAPSAVIEDANSAGSGQIYPVCRRSTAEEQRESLSWDQQEKLAKLEGWRQGLKIVEEAKAKSPASQVVKYVVVQRRSRSDSLDHKFDFASSSFPNSC